MQIFKFWGRKGVNISFYNPDHIECSSNRDASFEPLTAVIIGPTGRPAAMYMRVKKVQEMFQIVTNLITSRTLFSPIPLYPRTKHEVDRRTRCRDMTIRHFLRCEVGRHSVVNIYRGRQKSNPLGKIRYHWNCSKFFRQIYSFYWGGFRPHILQISLEYLVALKHYNYLNLSVHFSKWTNNLKKLRFWHKK